MSKITDKRINNACTNDRVRRAWNGFTEMRDGRITGDVYRTRLSRLRLSTEEAQELEEWIDFDRRVYQAHDLIRSLKHGRIDRAEFDESFRKLGLTLVDIGETEESVAAAASS